MVADAAFAPWIAIPVILGLLALVLGERWWNRREKRINQERDRWLRQQWRDRE